MKKMRLAVLVSGFVLAAVAANADIIYLDDQAGFIYAGDPDATHPVYSSIGNSGVAGGFADIGFANGVLYGLDGSGNLYFINTSTAAAALIGPTGVADGSLVGLSDCECGLLLAGGNGKTYSINLTTGAATPLGPGGGYTTAGDLDFDGSGNLYLTSTTPNPDTLFSIDPAGTGTALGTLPFANVFGMAYDSDTGIIWGYTFGGDQFDVNTSNPAASGTTVYTLSGGDSGDSPNLLGAASIDSGSPVPEPSTWVLIGSALILFASSRRFKASRAA